MVVNWVNSFFLEVVGYIIFWEVDGVGLVVFDIVFFGNIYLDIGVSLGV